MHQNNFQPNKRAAKKGAAKKIFNNAIHYPMLIFCFGIFYQAKAQNGPAPSSYSNTPSVLTGLGSDNLFGVYASGSTTYAATNGGVSISTDGGSTFNPLLKITIKTSTL